MDRPGHGQLSREGFIDFVVPESKIPIFNSKKEFATGIEFLMSLSKIDVKDKFLNEMDESMCEFFYIFFYQI